MAWPVSTAADLGIVARPGVGSTLRCSRRLCEVAGFDCWLILAGVVSGVGTSGFVARGGADAGRLVPLSARAAGISDSIHAQIVNNGAW
jgi:hypothetical protein